MTDTFKREDLDSPAEEIEETPAEEVADEVVDETVETRFDAEQATRAEHVTDEEPLRRFTDQLPPIAGGDDPMPDMSDADVQFDDDKYRTKMANWVKTQGRIEARRMLREEEDAKIGQKARQSIETKVEAFEKTHPDFKEKVRENPVLAKHQLHPEAGQIVAKSKYTAELLYRFGTDTALAIRTAGLNAAQQGAVIDRLITEIEAEKAKTAPRPKTLTRKGPTSRDEQLSGKSSMADFAKESRQKRFKGRFYK
jgi:hypothetical protein